MYTPGTKAYAHRSSHKYGRHGGGGIGMSKRDACQDTGGGGGHAPARPEPAPLIAPKS